MADNPDKKDFHDRNQIAGEQDHEVRYFAEQQGITPQQVRALIEKHGNQRDDLEREAKKLKG